MMTTRTAGCAALLVSLFLWLALGFAQEPAKQQAVKPTAEQLQALDALTATFRTAQAEQRAATLAVENVQLRYTLTLDSFRKALKVGDEYQWDVDSRTFKVTPNPVSDGRKQ